MDLTPQDSRRLTGPNLFSTRPGAIMEVAAANESIAEVQDAWKSQIEVLLDGVGWGDEEIFTRVFDQGVSLGFSAPIDALYAATELNEAALELAANSLAGRPGGEIGNKIARLKKSISEESNLGLLTLKAHAENKGVCFLSDDDQASVGMGAGSKTWAVDQLPKPEDVAWPEVHDIPLVLVTGTNGKSTTVRLLAAILSRAGKCAGITSTDYIRVGDEILDRGDYSGPGGARTLLRDPRVDATVLEVARGGILRRGLAVTKANAAIVTNVAEDHLFQYGINSLEELIEAKFVVKKALGDDGLLVLNADDAGIVAQAKSVSNEICWFSMDHTNPLITDHLAAGGQACVVRDKQISLERGKEREPVVAIDDIPITFNGAARHNVYNCLGAVALARKIGISPTAIAAGLQGLRGDADDNPGRGNVFKVRGARALVDFAHNEHGMTAITQTVSSFPARRRLVLLGHAGDRSDGEIRALTRAAWKMHPDRVIITEIPEYLRGRSVGELPALIRREFLSLGAVEESLVDARDCLSGVKKALDWAEPGDFLLLLVLSQRDEVLQLLKSSQPA